jgi:hypothetical protein
MLHSFRDDNHISRSQLSRKSIRIVPPQKPERHQTTKPKRAWNLKGLKYELDTNDRSVGTGTGTEQGADAGNHGYSEPFDQHSNFL